MKNKIEFCSNRKISAIYYALLQNGYEYYLAERSQEHINDIKNFLLSDYENIFFESVKRQNCEVYPYWPRAAILETASFYINEDFTGFKDFEELYNKIMTAGNIADDERTPSFWAWISDFPYELKSIVENSEFNYYFDWEQKWLIRKEESCKNELLNVNNFLQELLENTSLKLSSVKILLNPIKCVYSADFHIVDNCFIYSGGRFKIDSVIHEFLHHIVHPEIFVLKEKILSNYWHYTINDSYFLNNDDSGKLNAFEEYAVRQLTQSIIKNNVPNNIQKYLIDLIMGRFSQM